MRAVIFLVEARPRSLHDGSRSQVARWRQSYRAIFITAAGHEHDTVERNTFNIVVKPHSCYPLQAQGRRPTPASPIPACERSYPDLSHSGSGPNDAAQLVDPLGRGASQASSTAPAR